MRHRLALTLVCVLSALGSATALAGPALAAKDHATRTTGTTSSATHHSAKPKRSTHAAAHRTTTAHHTSATGELGSRTAANQILNECQSHGELTRSFPRADLEKALAIMSSSTQQYSNCSDVIHNALLHGIKAGDVTGGGSGSSTTTIVIIVVVVLLLLAAIFGGLAVRRRRGGEDDGDAGGPAPSRP